VHVRYPHIRIVAISGGYAAGDAAHGARAARAFGAAALTKPVAARAPFAALLA
jgi:hypothetical protein